MVITQNIVNEAASAHLLRIRFILLLEVDCKIWGLAVTFFRMRDYRTSTLPIDLVYISNNFYKVTVLGGRRSGNSPMPISA